MKLWIITGIVLISVLFITGCQPLPAVTPTAAEVIDIKITVQPPSTDVAQSPTPAAEVTTYPPSITYPSPAEMSYPGAYPQALPVDPYLAPGGPGYPTLEPFPFKTSEPGKATVRGALVVFDPVVLVPAPDDAIYLVTLTGGEGGPSTIPPVVKGESLQAEVDERTGDFVFTNVQPGQYAVVVVTPSGTEIPVRKYESNDLAIITVTEADLGKTIELGHLGL